MNSLVGLDIDLELRKFYWYSKVKAKILECKTKLNTRDKALRIQIIKELIKFLLKLTECGEVSALQSFELSQFDEELNLIRLSIKLLEDNLPSRAYNSEHSGEEYEFDEVEGAQINDNSLWIKQTIYTLELVQGLCLIFPKQTLLSLSILKTNYLKLILIYFKLNISNLKICCLETFQCILILNHEFIRNFEELGGIEEIIHLLKLKSTFREVRLKCVEFLYQYILPETNIARSYSKQSGESVKSSEDKMNYIASELGLDFVQNLLIPLNSNQ